MTYKSKVNFVDEALRRQLQQISCVVRTCTPDETTVLTRQLHHIQLSLRVCDHYIFTNQHICVSSKRTTTNQTKEQFEKFQNFRKISGGWSRRGYIAIEQTLYALFEIQPADAAESGLPGQC